MKLQPQTSMALLHCCILFCFLQIANGGKCADRNEKCPEGFYTDKNDDTIVCRYFYYNTKSVPIKVFNTFEDCARKYGTNCYQCDSTTQTFSESRRMFIPPCPRGYDLYPCSEQLCWPSCDTLKGYTTEHTGINEYTCTKKC